ncbi:type IV toxin-antitoxin system AbiEi family antitoxin domain-containing protein [Candidatus Hakubella thermalkaliphila]|uniref:type IV toxin-antitoxin system AbiEi family antitoxin domain-containing protein n=1 Tax=Candidatus Hakubella thermalkaliphila TaxID=2754717 RepID=UPI001592E1BA|nr:type IV toxin-antitoxin system AbiEi family antitoxin [Candidatus Hakubella thermalkaliphila]
MSKSETKLLTTLSAEGKNVFTYDDAKRVLAGDRGGIKQALYVLVEKGWVKNLERGKYLIVPLEGIAQGVWSEEAFVIASTLVNPYTIAYWSALNYYGYTEQISRTIFIQTTRRKFKAETEVLGIAYKFVTVRPNKFFGTTTIWFGNRKVAITDKEKTIIDCLDHPEYCGGIVEAAKGLANAVEDGIDLSQLTSYAKKMNNRTIFKRLGHLAEILELPVSNYLERWHKMISAGFSLLDPLSAKTGKFISRWNIQANVSKVNLTEWRTH